MSVPSSSASTLPPPCGGGCGFYGNKDTKNCCSVCFKKMYPDEWKMHQNNLNNNSSPANVVKPNDNNVNKPNDDNKPIDNKPKRKIQKKKHRCWNCRKKVTLAGQFECKCGYVFCSAHRYPDSHNCDFDWKKQHKSHLAKNNKVVAPAKIENKI